MAPHIINRILFHVLRKEINVLLAPFGITVDRLSVLELACTGRRTPAELARALQVTRPVVSTMVRALEEGGFVRRSPILGDRRSFHVLPTAKGRTTFEACARQSLAIELEARAKARIEMEGLQRGLGGTPSVPSWD